MMAANKALIVMTSHSQLGQTQKSTGFYLCEVVHPLFELERAGISVDLCSIRGGQPPLDENSRDLSDPINRDYMERTTFQYKLKNTLAVSEVDSTKYSAVILAGGYGALWDFSQNHVLHEILRKVYEANGVIAAISQGAAALASVKLSTNVSLVAHKKVTGMSNSEAFVTGLADEFFVLPESDLREQGALFFSKSTWQKNLVIDNRLITGQNPASAQAVGEAVRLALMSKAAKESAPMSHSTLQL